MIERLTRLLLLVAFLASLAASVWSVTQIWSNPALVPLREATFDEITSSVDRALALEATPAVVAERISDRLSEAPRNWVAIDALVALADDRAIEIPREITEDIEQARSEDYSATALASECVRCIVDISECSLSAALVCKGPILLTPIEDLRGLGQAAFDAYEGDEVDRIDLGLSVLGLSATALSIPSGGTSLSVKAGASAAKLARGLKLMSPRLTEMADTGLRAGVDWAKLPAVRSPDDLATVLRTDALAPLTATLGDLGRSVDVIGPSATLHLLPLVDDARDARALARLAESIGPRVTGAAEVLGKSRLFRAVLRVTDVTIGLFAGVAGLILSVTSALASFVNSAVLRRARHLSR